MSVEQLLTDAVGSLLFNISSIVTVRISFVPSAFKDKRVCAKMEELRKRVAELEAELLRVTSGQPRQKIAEMSSEVVDSNPYR
jgi:hypothetical protein